MAISAKDVMSLRNRTGLGMMECKKALTETDGDADAAIKLLREKLGKKMEERSDRAATEGAIAVAKNDGAVAIIVLSSETDFTAKNDTFVDAAQKIADIALEGPDGAVEANDAIKELVENLRITTKENISFIKGEKRSADKVGSYVHHNRKVAAILTGEGDLDEELLTGIAQHVTAAVPPLMDAPTAVDTDSLDAAAIEEAKKRFTDEAVATGKPAEIAEKIAGGKLRKWQDDQTLLGQNYIRDMENNKPIREYLPAGSKLTGFQRYSL